MPGAGSNRINEFGFYTNYYTLPINMGIYTRMRSNSSPAQVVYEYQITLDHGNTFGSGIQLYLLFPLNRQE